MSTKCHGLSKCALTGRSLRCPSLMSSGQVAASMKWRPRLSFLKIALTFFFALALSWSKAMAGTVLWPQPSQAWPDDRKQRLQAMRNVRVTYGLVFMAVDWVLFDLR